MKELDYQIEAIEDLKNQVNKVLNFSESKTVIFQAPTGSGKTYMVSEALKKLVKDRKDDKKLSFIWVSVRMLHEQSKEKLEKYYENDRLLQCSYFEDLVDKRIGENEILFINWHSINKKDINIYVRENEQDNNLNSIVQNTKEEGREIILIIDESHHTAKSEKSRELIETIGPKVTIEVSATPHIKENIGGWITIDLGRVKAEEMIKSEIAVNPEFMGMEVGPKDSDTIVIEQALNKREELAKLYKKEGADINPLVLIQLPDKKSNLINKKDDVIEILRKEGITEKNGKLAVWLSEEKTDNLANIDKPDNEVEVLVFKQAIALGWDCPRASILVIFRESKSFTFTIQTIGRIMRMPEFKYYSSEELNKGYVFTNLPHIEITEDYAKDYVTIYESKRDNQRYKKIGLFSVYLKRQRERTRLSGDFSDIFMQVAEGTNLQKKITVQPEKITLPIIADGQIKDVDKSGPIESKGQIDVKLNETELRNIWDKFIFDMCSPYAPVDSSDRMKTAIYQFFKKKYRLDKYDPRVQRIVIAKENRKFFIDAINLAKEKYKIYISDKLSETREKIEVPDWEVPVVIGYNSICKRESHPRSIMKPFYTKKPSDPEQLFMEALDESNKVEWWFKNGESEIKYFAVERTDGGAFYPDFIVKFKSGSIGIFDTKKDRTAKEEDAGPRADGLQKSIKEQKKKGKNLWGGIVINVQGSWRYNDEEEYHYDPGNLSKWKILDF
jgi:type III restriction enzyme